ncbi:enoyl CoA hydratase domain-containing protein 1 [Dinochytrium kinnereticum]|nr:enoyl CoA hydratase domain-containing protein 1 [Dinochytrium kinnereticum]
MPASPLTTSAARIIRTKFAKLGSGTVTLSLPHSVHHVPSPSVHKPSTAKSPTEGHQNVAVITLRNHARKNALSPAMMAQFADAVDLLESVVERGEREDDAAFPLVGVVLQGEGTTFCSGFDLGVAAESFLTSESGAEMSLLMHDTLSRLRRLPLISVAAVQGYALGGGAELMTACDLRVVDESATVRFVQVKMGVIPGWQGATRLASLVGRNNALRLLASAKPLTGTDCHLLGLADELVASPKDAPSAAKSMLDTWTAPENGGAPVAIRGVKKVISRFDEGGDMETQLEFERGVFGGLWGGKANVEAVLGAMKKKTAADGGDA